MGNEYFKLKCTSKDEIKEYMDILCNKGVDFEVDFDDMEIKFKLKKDSEEYKNLRLATQAFVYRIFGYEL